jgi:hypothetical protein
MNNNNNNNKLRIERMGDWRIPIILLEYLAHTEEIVKDHGRYGKASFKIIRTF